MNNKDTPWRCFRLTVPCSVNSPGRWRSEGHCGGSLCHPHCHSHQHLHQLPSRHAEQTCGKSNFLQREFQRQGEGGNVYAVFKPTLNATVGSHTKPTITPTSGGWAPADSAPTSSTVAAGTKIEDPTWTTAPLVSFFTSTNVMLSTIFSKSREFSATLQVGQTRPSLMMVVKFNFNST